MDLFSDIFSKTKIYGRDRRDIATTKEIYVVEAVKGKTVLHVGCTDSPITEKKHKAGILLHELIEKSASEVVGIDLCELGVQYMKDAGFKNIRVMNAEKMEFDRCFDVIVAGDLVEHVSNPGLFLQQIPKLLATNGRLILSVPHAFSRNWAYSMWYRNKELVHKDHCCYYSPKTMATLCSRFDLLPSDVRYLYGTSSTNLTWKGKLVDIVPGLRRFVNYLRDVPSIPRNPFMLDHFVMSFVNKSDVPRDADGYEI